MNYATGYALNTNELFLNFPNKKLKMTAKECEEMIGNRHKEFIAKQVFRACVAMVLDDIIENNATFKLPTRVKKAEIGMKRFERDEFTKCRQNGRWYTNKTIENIIQVAGRSVRSKTDEAVTYILDSSCSWGDNQYKEDYPKWFDEAIVKGGDL